MRGNMAITYAQSSSSQNSPRFAHFGLVVRLAVDSLLCSWGKFGVSNGYRTGRIGGFGTKQNPFSGIGRNTRRQTSLMLFEA
jgi:hypothetical protein